MKQLTEMSWNELTKLREQLREDLGDDTEDDSENCDSDDEDGWTDSDLVAALTGLEEVKEANQPAVKKGAPKSPPKGYPTDKSLYADPTNFKYPLNNASRVHAALSYFSNPDNIRKGGYSPEEQKFMWRRIIAAAEKFGIHLSDDVLKHGEKLGESISESEGVNKELNEQEIIALIEKTIKEQMPQNPGGMLAQGTKGHGGMESYQTTVRVPPDIEDLHNQLEAFRKEHAADKEALGKASEGFTKSNKDLSDKVDTLTKQMQALQEAMKPKDSEDTPDTADTEDTGDTEDVEEEDTGDSEDSEDSEDSKDIEKSKESKESKEAKESKQTEAEKTVAKAHVKKQKEAIRQAQPEGIVATTEMTEGNGANPPGFSAIEEPTVVSFGERMNRASKLRRRAIGANA